MALTAEQKEANKIARRERSRGWNARRALRNAAKVVGQQAISDEHGAGCAAASEQSDLACKALQEARRQGEERVAALKAEIEAEKQVLDAAYQEKRAEERRLWDLKRDADRELDKRLDVEFPDLTGAAFYSAAAWGNQQ